ncbi:MAG: aldo/keto reductase [Rubripirellula sp.]
MTDTPEADSANKRPRSVPQEPSVALGLWPLAGITTIGVTPKDVEETINAAIEAGITTFDSAYSYGYNGESDHMIGRHLKPDRERFRIIGKVGQRWTTKRQRIIDGSEAQLSADAEQTLKRMRIESLDLLMLHSPDPNVPLEESVLALCKLHQRGLCREIGVCNVNVDQLQQFSLIAEQASVPVRALQCPLNLLQRDSLTELLPTAETKNIRAHVYWTLMKGLLAGRISRDHQFAAGDSRPNYEVYQGHTRERAHRIIDALHLLSHEVGLTAAQLSIGWALSQPGVEHALVGARRPEQVKEVAAARCLNAETLSRVNAIVRDAQDRA